MLKIWAHGFCRSVQVSNMSSQASHADVLVRSLQDSVLFTVSNTSTPNVVVYTGLRNAAGYIDSANPVHAEWVMLGSDPPGGARGLIREPLSIIFEQGALGPTAAPVGPDGAPGFTIQAVYRGERVVSIHEDEDGQLCCLLTFTDESGASLVTMRIDHVLVNIQQEFAEWTGVDVDTGSDCVVRMFDQGMRAQIVS
jgi:hypothetical protein